jgi:Zn-finger protein
MRYKFQLFCHRPLYVSENRSRGNEVVRSYHSSLYEVVQCHPRNVSRGGEATILHFQKQTNTRLENKKYNGQVHDAL